MTAYGRPPTSTTAVASASSIGTLLSPKRRMPARSPSASANAAPEHERDVLDGVVLVHLEVAGRPDLEVEQAVVGERAQEVVVEPDARGDVGARPSRRGRARS